MTMTVSELIAELQKMPQDAKVAIYSEMVEDSDMPNKVSLYSEDEGPYNKGDDVWAIYGIPSSEKIVFIEMTYTF